MIPVHKISSLRQLMQTAQQDIPELSSYENTLNNILQDKESQQKVALLTLYTHIFPLIEQWLWTAEEFEQILVIYQRLFREYEALIEDFKIFPETISQQYDFILSIPIADRPEHLRGCLESIFQICQLYHYGGKTDGFFNKVSVIVTEDSKEIIHVQENKKLTEEYSKKGLRVYHYSFKEQYDLMLKIPEQTRHHVRSIIGDPETDNFYHKGQAVTRNLSYLKALEITQDKNNTLYYCVDSDQQFRVNRTTAQGDQYVYALNYFYTINHIFNTTDTAMLTGKLVCDPPVSPSVMTANFLDDIIVFFQQLSDYQALDSCQFHPKKKIEPDDAAYHDMAQLFGLKNTHATYNYCCPIQTEHNHIACLKSFSERINYFFFGEHLTRKTYFSYKGTLTDIAPARTIYPGNYITTFEGLKYIIPFGLFRLRMSGPTAGRLVQSEIKARFASINLPMLHARTLQTDFNDEYRPGVEDNHDNIDLTNEFERQFFGDLMLFSVDRLTQSGIAIEEYTAKILHENFAQTEQELLALYAQKHKNVLQKCDVLEILINNNDHWWNQHNLMDPITHCTIKEYMQQIQQFINNVRHNFDKKSLAYKNIQSTDNRTLKIDLMIQALLDYRHDRNSWDDMLINWTTYS